MKKKMKMKMKMNFRFRFHFGFDFCFCFCFLKVFAFLLTLRGLEVPQTFNCLLIDLKVPQHFFNSTWLRGAIDGQPCLTWPRYAIAFCFANFPRGLAMRQVVNFLLMAQKCKSTQKYGTQPDSNMQNSMMLFPFFVFNQKFPFWVNLVQKALR